MGYSKKNLILVHTVYTKHDTYGNIYHRCKVTHPQTGRSFVTGNLPSGNLDYILRDAFGGWESVNIYNTSECTGSARTSSLPTETTDFYEPCRFTKEWARELRKVGYSKVRNPKVMK